MFVMPTAMKKIEESMSRCYYKDNVSQDAYRRDKVEFIEQLKRIQPSELCDGGSLCIPVIGSKPLEFKVYGKLLV